MRKFSRVIGIGTLAFLLCVSTFGDAADLKPVGGVNLFGGAEKDSGMAASGIGGVNALGLFPLTKDLGLQGALSFSGGQGFRFGLNAGPVLNFSSGKAGLFVDYSYWARETFNYVDIRGSGGYYFDKFDALLSYSQPVSSVQRSGGKKMTGINELHALLRFYPTNEIELNGGFLVNSFAGPGHGDNGGTGVGGSFGASFKLFDPIVINLVQAKIDNRARYSVTSGIEFIYGSPLQEWLREHISFPSFGGAPGQGKQTKQTRTEQSCRDC
jgi:hypothetical protein